MSSLAAISEKRALSKLWVFLVGTFLVKSARHLQWLFFFLFFCQTTISL